MKPNRTYLSKNLIALLSYGGVPNEFFKGLLESNLEDANHVFSNKRVALRGCLPTLLLVISLSKAVLYLDTALFVLLPKI